MKILLTGASGMVGRNFLEHPQAKYFDVLSPDRSELDLTNSSAVAEYVRFHMPDLIIHAAGRVGGIQANVASPVSFLIENLDMGRNLLLASREAGVRQFLNLGSSCMYPKNRRIPLREEMILTGSLELTNEGYALAKLVIAKLCEYISREDCFFQYKTLIPCNIYGKFDNYDPEYSHMLAAAIAKIHDAKMRGSETVEIWGTGVERRELMYASDLSDCMWFCVLNFKNMPSFLNAGIGRDFSVLDYYKAVARIVGFKGSFSFDKTRPSGMRKKLLDIGRLKAFGWRAKTSLEDGITNAYQYFTDIRK